MDAFRTFSQDVTGEDEAAKSEATPNYKVSPEFVGRVFEEYIMPLTKDVEVEYLLRRLDGTDEAPCVEPPIKKQKK